MIKGLIVAVACAFSLAGCSVQKNTPYLDRAETIFSNVWKKYRVPEHLLFSEYYPNSYRPNLTYFQDSAKQAREVSYLWPMSGVFSSTVILAELNPSKYKSYLDSMVTAVEKYYDDGRKPAGYQAYPVKLDYSDRYYDDNGLVGIDYIDAYRVTKNPKYLEKAKEVMEFIMSGWSDDFGGGVSWLEGVRDQKPACSNGKATVLAIKLYQATGDQKYLDLGTRFYNWMMNTLKDDSLNIVWNSLGIQAGSSHVSKEAYTYNTGTMIQSAVRLYTITKDQKYLNDAQALAEGSYSYYVKFTDQNVPYIEDLPWFIVVLFRGYQELYEVDHKPKYIEALIASADWAWENARDPEGLIFRDWTGEKDEEKQPKWLLDESCMAEMYARIAIIKNEKINRNEP
jgi:uncharacterized protein YyaL (SSP411 family)